MTPIEEKFWEAARSSYHTPYLHPQANMHIDAVVTEFSRERAADLLVARQVAWGPFVVDFVMMGRQTSGHDLAIVIECDGHDYHERTKEQAQRDRSRDRYFTKQAVPVLRFTGSELWRSAERCLEEAIACLQGHDAYCASKPRPEFVSRRMREILQDESLHWLTQHIAYTAADAADENGVARISFERLRQLYDVSETDLDIMGFDLVPYLSLRSIDVHGRLVFRFRKYDVVGIE